MKCIPPLLILSLTSFCLADDPIPANRPNFTSNPTVVPLGMELLEGGATYFAGASNYSLSRFELNYRRGIAKNFEFDFFGPQFNLTQWGADTLGWGDAGFSVSYQIGPIKGWDLLVGAGATVPTGNQSLTGGSINPTTLISVGRNFTEKLSFTGTRYGNYQNNQGAFPVGYTNAFMFSYNFSPATSAFFEYRVDTQNGVGDSTFCHAGYVFAHNARQQADIHFGWQNTNAGDSVFFVGAGYAYRF